jgi:hypothetical protein
MLPLCVGARGRRGPWTITSDHDLGLVLLADVVMWTVALIPSGDRETRRHAARDVRHVGSRR